MNSKRSKRHKSAPKKSKNTKDDGAEVFVLPPNLLEKLGIQLGNIQSTHEYPTQTHKTDLSEVRTKITSKENNHDSEIVLLNPVRSSPIQKETSILETASLMKESLFLSPTFVPTVANVIAGEVEIANGCKQSEKTATSTIDDFDTEHNLVDSFDIQQIMNSNNENGVIEFAEKILQSRENQVHLQAQEKDIDKCNGVSSKPIDTNIDTTIAIQDVLVGLPLQKNTNEIEIVPDPHCIQGGTTTISTDTQLYPCMDKQIPEEQALIDDIEDCEKITPEDLEINKSHHDNLLISEIESFQADFLDSLNDGNDSEARKTNMSQSAVTIIKAENTTKNKIQLISQEIVNLKDCKIASPLSIHNLIPVTIDTIISTRKDNKSENLISKHIENYNPLSCDFNQDKTNENSSHMKKNKNLEKFTCNDVITDHDSMDLSDKIKSQEYSEGTDLDSNNEIMISKQVNTISLLSVNNNTISNIPYKKSEPNSNYTLDIPCPKPEENLTNKPEIQELQLEIPSKNINITPEEDISLKKHSHTGLISNDASIGNMAKIKLDEEIKRKKKHLPSLGNAKRNKEKANQSINGPSKSKSCVQGVEKPGGDNPVDPMEFSINKVGLKTYQRIKKSRKEMKNYSIGCDTLNVVLNNDIDAHENRVVNSCDGVEKYCLCNDFGHLTNCDEDENDVYEHIHFWQTESVSCDPEIIFGIYYEDTMDFNDSALDNVTDVEEIREKKTTPICWQAIYTKKSDNDYDEESSIHSSTDNTETSLVNSLSVIFESKREHQPLKHNQEQNSVSETKDTTEVLEHSTNIDKNIIKIPSHNEYETENSNMNAGTAVNEFICETNVSTTNISLLQPSVIKETTFSETNNEKANETAKSNSITNAEIKSKQLKNNITSHQIKPYDVEKPMQTVSENNQLEDASPSYPKEQMDQLLQVSLHKSEDDIIYDILSSYQMSKDSQLEIINVINVNKNMSDTNVINKNIIDLQSDIAVQSEAPMDIQELNFTCEKSTQEPITGLKRRGSAIEAVSASNMNEEDITPTKKTVCCGVCTELVAEVDWTNHASEKHNSIAWKFGQTMDFDDEQFLGVLVRKIKKNGILECSICNFKINHLATFILHIENCVKTKIAKDVEKLKTVKCAVCMIDIPLKDWSKHLIKHNYLAWVDGDPKLDLNDKNMVRMHLQSVCEVLGRLTCKCGARRTQVLGFLNHLSICKNQVSDQDSVRCGVCRRILDSKFWNDHIKEHNYLAWKDGELALDMENDSELRRHLCIVSKRLGGLTCQTCGQKRKSGKKYLQHIRKCKLESPRPVTDSANNSLTSPEVTFDSSLTAKVKLESTDNRQSPDIPNKPQTSENAYEGSNSVETTNTSIVCGICNNDVEVTNWITHIEAEHDYLAWKFGEKPLDLENEIEVLQHLKEVISKCKVLVCKKCGLGRKYAKNYMNHIKQCDGNVQHANTSSNTLELNETVECSRLDSDSSRRESADQTRTARRRKRAKIESSSAVTDSANSSVTSPQVTLNSTLEATVKLESTDNPEIPDKPNKPQTSENVDEGSNPVETANTSVVCGVCNNNVEVTNWITHIELEHDYLAWKFGENPIDLENESEVLKHLKEVISKCQVLVCKKCGLSRKYAKLYMNHIKQCDGNVQHANTSSNTTLELNETVECSRLDSDSSRRESADQARTVRRRKRAKIESPSAVTDSANSSVTSPEVTLAATVKLESTDNPEIPDIPNKPQTSETIDEGSNPVETANTSVVCGVCNNNVEVTNWITHIELEHDYLAWKFGENPIDLENESEVLQHLKEVISKCKVLVCKKCGLGRKYAKNYMNHIEQCDGNVQHANTSSNTTLELNKTVECSRLDSDSSRRKSADKARTARRSKRAQISSDFDEEDNVVLSKRRRSVVPQSKSVRCGVCKMDVQENTWYTHIEKEHHYLAWKEGETPLNMEDEKEVWSHLLTVSQILDKLVCYKCNYTRKKPKVFLKHIKNCSGTGEEMTGITDQSAQESISANDYIEFEFRNPDVQTAIGARVKIEKEEKTPVKQKKKRTDISETELVTCAVCKKSVKINIWIQHIKQEHDYLAWIEGKPALNLNDEDAVREHLRTISKKEKGLVCNKCEVVMKYPKPFLKHVKTCSGKVHSSDLDMVSDVNSSDLIKCGVCSKDIASCAWIKHIQVAHNYLAWRADETPIDLDDEDAVKDHLTKLLRSTSHLICAKCGFTRRFAAYYMTHMETCNGVPPVQVFEDKKSLLSKNEGLYECAMCHKKILPKHWKKHAFDEHYNVTWIVGDIPIDLKSPYGADKYLKEYQRHEKLVCKICGESRASLMGFYIHIITCGKTEEQMDLYKEDCTTCGQRYFGVYRSLHMATHRQQEISKYLEMNDPPELDEESPTVIGRRKAAENYLPARFFILRPRRRLRRRAGGRRRGSPEEGAGRANSVIEQYQKSVSKVDYAYKCDNCSFGTDLVKHFQNHKCDLDADAVSEESQDDQTSDDYDEHLSDLVEEEEVSTTKKEAPRPPSWMPIRMLNCDAYYERLIDTFRHIHLTEDRLFSEWLISQYSFVSEDQVKEYMPKLQQSCKVLLNRSWEQFEMFEGKRDNRVHSMFVGGSIKRIRWVPCELDPDVERNFLAVSAHLGEDAPRHNYDELPTHPGLIQIWDVGAFDKNAPKFALGLAHDYGTVWDMDWCPSGARENFENSREQKEWSRLGLLAIACSNGLAYILSVPYPDSITSSENLFVKLKHVAELRICSMESDRKRYQATAISWSKKKNHSEIVVAYSDGTIARYDLKNSSPLLKASEDDVTIYYPYHDERSVNGCITGVQSFPGHGPVADAVCSSSTVGAALAGGAGAPYAARVMSHLPSTDALFTPAWPTAMVTSDEGLMHVTPNELDWHGCGRKLTTLYGAAACERCGRVLTYMPPLLRVARHFPPWSEPYRRAVASINVVLLSSKRNLLKQTTDELSVKIEPITYEDCVNKYGVEFYILQKFRTSGHVKEPSPERFPLADVTSMAYCTSEKFHDKVAVATYSGHIFIFKPAA